MRRRFMRAGSATLGGRVRTRGRRTPTPAVGYPAAYPATY